MLRDNRPLLRNFKEINPFKNWSESGWDNL